jgi:VanZ family protein
VDYDLIRVRARIGVEGVVAGKNPWNCARLLFAQYRADGRWIPVCHGLAAECGSKDWARHEKVFKVSSDADHAAVLLEQSGTEGLARFDQIRVQPVRLRASFTWWRILFAVSWMLTAALYFKRCRLHRRKLRMLIILNAVAILAGTLMPGTWIIDNADRMKATLRESLLSRAKGTAETRPAATGPARKTPPPEKQMDWFTEVEIEAHQAGHFILFAALCFLVYLSAALERQHPVYFIKVGFDVLLFAAVTESLQLLTLDRSAGVGDLRIDIYGMALALLLFVLVLPVIRRCHAKSP